MSKRKARIFKADLATELRSLAEVLRDEGLLRDPSPHDEAASMCTTNYQSNRWKYNCLSLRFVVNHTYLDFYKRTIPGNLSEIIIELSVKAEGRCLDQSDHMTDPFEELTVDCEMEGRDSQGRSFFWAWHLDRNEGNTGETSKNFVHPCYHLQFGGDHLPRDIGYGRLLLVEAPRVAHPPLDAVLAIDFLLSNYFPVVWRKLRKNAKYPRIIQQAQRRFWLPYARAVTRGNGWGTDSLDTSWDVKNIWPQIILPA